MLSVVVPVYNSEESLPALIQRILGVAGELGVFELVLLMMEAKTGAGKSFRVLRNTIRGSEEFL